ncbi:MAG TPA: hypothetical protein VGH34_12820 [Vicinamibacterales bacterium]
MKALYNNRICNIVDLNSDVTLAEDGREFVVSLGDKALVIDPTDKEVADADNPREWSGLGAEAANHLRSMLRGDLSSSGTN